MPVPCYGNVIAANFVLFVMEGLGDVAEEVDYEFEILFAICGAVTPVVDALGVVCYSAHDAARGAAVAGVVYAAGCWGVVFCVYETMEEKFSRCVGKGVGGRKYWYGALNFPAVV